MCIRDRETKDTSLLARAKMTGEELHEIIPFIVQQIKTQFGNDIFSFETIIDSKAKFLAKSLFDHLELILNKKFDVETKKELSTRIFIEVCRLVKGDEWLKQFQ